MLKQGVSMMKQRYVFVILTLLVCTSQTLFAVSETSRCVGGQIDISCEDEEVLIITDVFFGKESSKSNDCETNTACSSEDSDDCVTPSTSRSVIYNKCMGKPSCSKQVQRSEAFRCDDTFRNSCYTHIWYDCVQGKKILIPRNKHIEGEDVYVKLTCRRSYTHCHWIIENLGMKNLQISAVGPQLTFQSDEVCETFLLLDGSDETSFDCTIIHDGKMRGERYQAGQNRLIISTTDSGLSPNYTTWIKVYGTESKITYYDGAYSGDSFSTKPTNDDGPIIGAVIGVLILCTIVIVVFVIWRRRKRKSSQTARNHCEPTRGKEIQLDTEHTYNGSQKETISDDSHIQNQESRDPKTGYKISVPADYSYTKIMTVRENDTGNEESKYMQSKPNGPNVNDDYSLEKVESTDDYSLVKPLNESTETSKFAEQDHYGYSHMPGLEKRAASDNEEYGKPVGTSASHADDYGYSHMGDERSATEKDSASHYQHGINIQSVEHDNYGYAHMPK